MKRFTVFALILMMGFVGTLIATAQMMGGKGDMMGNKSRQGSDQSEQQSRFTSMMHDMQKHDMQMMNRFDSLQQDFGRMMKMNDISELKKAMRQHNEMMTDMRGSMMQQTKMWDQTMTMMDSMGVMSSGQMMNMPMKGK